MILRSVLVRLRFFAEYFAPCAGRKTKINEKMCEELHVRIAFYAKDFNNASRIDHYGTLTKLLTQRSVYVYINSYVYRNAKMRLVLNVVSMTFR